MRLIWERLGGDAAPLPSLEWWRPLRPWGSLTVEWERRTGSPAASSVRRIARGLDRASLRFARREHRPGAPIQPLTGAAMTEALPDVVRRLRLFPDYDPTFVDWLLAELACATVRGELRASLVPGRDGRLAGYFVYYLVRGGLCPVIAVAAPDEPAAGAVLDAVFEDARAEQAAVLYGRLEPALVRPVFERHVLVRYAGSALIHSADPAIAALALSRYNLLTRLEGEWWMVPHLGAVVGGPVVGAARAG